MTVKRNSLNTRQNWLLCNFVVEEYTKSRMNDTVFAKKASEVLGFEVKPNQIGERRREFEIPSFTEASQKPETVIERLEALERRVSSLEKKGPFHTV